jgi:hypothetical protein
MKIKKADGTELEIKLKRRHTKKLMKCYSKLTDDGVDIGKGMEDYNSMLDEIAKEVTGLSEDDYENLDAEDCNLVLNKIQEVTLGQLDFLKSSLKLVN